MNGHLEYENYSPVNHTSQSVSQQTPQIITLFIIIVKLHPI